jgi:hypothetical protein
MSRAMSLMAHAIPYLLMIALATRVAYFLKLSLIPSIFDTVATSDDRATRPRNPKPRLSNEEIMLAMRRRRGMWGPKGAWK